MSAAKQEIATQQDRVPARQGNESAAIIAVIERAAMNPEVDIDKMERLLQMQERIHARNAEMEFNAALAELQNQLPSITERGKIKNKNGGVQSTYALWEDINEAIKPKLQVNGFALSFRTDCSDGVTVTGILSHRSGHRETTSIKLPADVSGSKNNVQAIASSVSYGKRYTAGALLNLTSHGEDDDGQMAGMSASGSSALEEMNAATSVQELSRIMNALPADQKRGMVDHFNARRKELMGA